MFLVRRVCGIAFFGVLVVLMTLALTCTAVLADNVTLNALRVVPGPSGGVSLILTFNGAVPAARTYGDGTTSVSILLANTVRAANTPANISPAGSIASGTVTAVGDSVNVQLNLATAVPVRLNPGAGNSLVITVPAAKPSVTNAVPGAELPPPPPSRRSALSSVREVVHLNYADLSEVAAILVEGANVAPNDTFNPQPQAGNFGTGPLGSSPTLPTAAGPTVAYGVNGTTGSLAQRLNQNVAIDRRLNSVILTGSRELVDSYKAIIADLDIPLGRVMLETQIVELTDTAARDLGIDFTNAGGQLAAASYTVKSLQTAQGSFSLQAAVFAQVQRGQGHLIAQPRILASDGAPASIVTGDALPIVTSIAVSGVNAIQQQVQYVNVGVNLQIQPRISTEGYVTAHIFSAVSSVTGYSQTYPQISQRQASTEATVKDGEPFIIGGLLEKSEISSLSKLPGIGDIPFLGSLFRVRHQSATATNLYIIVTPRIITYGEHTPVPPNATLAPVPRY